MIRNTVYGLILSGGKSSRMGTDKGSMVYQGLPQREHLYQLLDKVCERTFLSIRPGQQKDLAPSMDSILDNNEFPGPYNGIMSAYCSYPKVAWLVLACDLPLMDMDAISELLKARSPEKCATAFAAKETGYPEPLCAIWEPQGLEKALVSLRKGAKPSPTDFLALSDVALVHPKNEQVLFNANSVADFQEALAKLSGL